MWKIQNAQEFVEDFIISKKSGTVQRHDNQVVPVTYIACNVGVITHKVLTIEVSCANKPTIVVGYFACGRERTTVTLGALLISCLSC